VTLLLTSAKVVLEDARCRIEVLRSHAEGQGEHVFVPDE
jgi:hypothetical protein